MTRWLERASELGDPGRVHAEGRVARVAVEEAREQVAAFIGTRPRQVVFTSGGTEAVNSASWGALRSRTGRPVLMARVEHSSVRESSSRLADWVELAVDSTGRIDPFTLEDAICDCEARGQSPALVHCQSANHEIGTLQPVTEVVECCHRHGVLVHVDACASFGHLPLDFEELGADLLSVSAHKIGGPAGAGALVVRRGLRIESFIVGGDQERARRAGFENLPAIAGFGAVSELLADRTTLDSEAANCRRLASKLVSAATDVEGVELLGDPSNRVPHIVCLAIEGVEAEPVLLELDRAGIAAHSGSSCSSEALAPSPVLEAIGADPERSLRLSVGWSSSDDDVDAFARAFAPALGRLRALRSA
jgi:cysteine desulfurase